MIVADTCLIVHLFNDTVLTEIAQKIRKKDDSWIVPSLWQEEYANVLSKLARKESRNINEVLKHFSFVLGELQGAEVVVDIKKALRVSVDYKISVYDAHFVSLALDFGVLLVTEDKEVLKNCKGLAASMKSFLAND